MPVRRLQGLVVALTLACGPAWAQQSFAPGAITATPLAPPPGANGQSLAAPAGPETTTVPAPGQPADTTATPAQGQPADTATTTPSGTTPSGTAVGGTAPPSGTEPLDTAPPAFTPAPAVPFAWQPGKDAELQVLDKVDAQATTLMVKVGSSVQYRSLTIAVRACDASTKDEHEDATAFLDITDSHPDEPGFHGWMLKSDPSVSMLQHPIYDVRVLGCHA